MLARREASSIIYARARVDAQGFPFGLFCVSPTVLEAINQALTFRGFPALWVMADGTIGPSDPLLMIVECEPNPFVN